MHVLCYRLQYLAQTLTPPCAYFAAAESRISLHPAPTLEEGPNSARWQYGWLTSVRYFCNKVKGKILTGMNKFDL